MSNLWIDHLKVGAWMDGPMDHFTIKNSRILDTTADGRAGYHRYHSADLVTDLACAQVPEGMLAGLDDTDTGRAHAEELLATARWEKAQTQAAIAR